MTTRAATLVSVAALVGLTACAKAPPPSLMPNAQAALDRMKATAACGVALQADARIDHLGSHGRLRGELLILAAVPARLRLGVVGPMNSGMVATLTSDGQRFALADLRNKRFLYGPPSVCNISRLTTVPIPGHALVSLLRGQAPILKHAPGAATIRWDGGGFYVVTVPSTRDATEEIRLEPAPDDFYRPWSEQRMRVRRVVVRQYGDVLYDAEMGDFKPTAMSGPRVDPDGIDPPIPPSGPACTAELPRSIHVDVPPESEEVIFNYDSVTWNPPLEDAQFTQQPPPGMVPERVTCE